MVELAFSDETFSVEAVRVDPNIVEKTVSFAFNEDTIMVDTSI